MCVVLVLLNVIVLWIMLIYVVDVFVVDRCLMMVLCVLFGKLCEWLFVICVICVVVNVVGLICF